LAAHPVAHLILAASVLILQLLVGASSLMSKKLLGAPKGLPKAALSQALHV
jgi:hypothetical protein